MLRSQAALPGVGETRDAIIDPSGVYRYRLERGGLCVSPRTVLFVMLNPSTADAERDDPTIRRCMAFSRAWDYGRLLVCNLFAFRATDPDDLYAEHLALRDVVGPENDSHLLFAARAAQLVVCAWGNGGALANRDQAVLAMLRQYGRSPHALGFTADGHPKHPLARGKSSISRAQRPIPMLPDPPPTAAA